jgi:glycosyltransferase involved in cell wall biosynthesis
VVDADRYPAAALAGKPPVLGWIGSPATAHYLAPIAGVLARVQRRTGARVRVIGVDASALPGVDAESVAWSEAGEGEVLASLDVGLMPLTDTPWERGKCGYKLIQYMACGLPVVSSPVGAALDIVEANESGLFADGDAAWEAALERLVTDPDARVRMGERGRERVRTAYSLAVQAPRMERILAEARASASARR